MRTRAGLRHRLALNENPYGPLPSVHAALTEALAGANRYPEFIPATLPRLIAEHHGYDRARIAVGPGATGVIMWVLQEFAAAGGRVVMTEPTFDGYPLLTATVGGEAVLVPLTPQGCQDLAAMAAIGDASTALIVLCNPHNPTGTRLAPEALDSFLDAVDPSVPVLLDEAYIEFVAPAERADTEALLDRHPNLIAVRTFSKAFGLAALRIGYAIGHPDLIARIRRWQVPFGMHALAEVGVRACYAAELELAARVEAITDERTRLATGLRELGWRIPTSAANFVYLPVADAAELHRLDAAFTHAEILVKHCPAGIRVTVGDCAATEAVLAAVAAVR
ncbi:pyridoxal phosphate-dependent aminotransferase [Nocardia sp. NPDC050406]|uniref:pyridoxal phosphate-dependent aminotransferase n=1 Tax=Nocardia sp. NPDC050406 TaxID=3364318 RepID=UPI0037A58C14